MIQALLTHDRDLGKILHSVDLPFINWSIRADKEVHTWMAGGFDVLVSTNLSQMKRWRKAFGASHSNGPSRVFLHLNPNVSDAIFAHQLEASFARHLPTESLGKIEPLAAALIDHMFFQERKCAFHDLMLLPPTANRRAIQKRFREWSIHLHPDRFATRPYSERLLVERINTVYALLCETYGNLTDANTAAIHRYWLSKGQVDKAVLIEETGPLAKIKHLHTDPKIRSDLVDALRLRDSGQWHSAYALIEPHIKSNSNNEPLTKFAETLRNMVQLIESTE